MQSALHDRLPARSPIRRRRGHGRLRGRAAESSIDALPPGVRRCCAPSRRNSSTGRALRPRPAERPAPLDANTRRDHVVRMPGPTQVLRDADARLLSAGEPTQSRRHPFVGHSRKRLSVEREARSVFVARNARTPTGPNDVGRDDGGHGPGPRIPLRNASSARALRHQRRISKLPEALRHRAVLDPQTIPRDRRVAHGRRGDEANACP